MTTEQWLEEGFMVMFRYGSVFLLDMSAGYAYTARINDGMWRDYDDVKDFPWVKMSFKAMPHSMRNTLLNAAAACYCGGDMRCDFCTGGLRRAPERKKREDQHATTANT